jgi:hypothetical protein
MLKLMPRLSNKLPIITSNFYDLLTENNFGCPWLFTVSISQCSFVVSLCFRLLGYCQLLKLGHQL